MILNNYPIESEMTTILVPARNYVNYKDYYSQVKHEYAQNVKEYYQLLDGKQVHEQEHI